jgi:hypothetical protein
VSAIKEQGHRKETFSLSSPPPYFAALSYSKLIVALARPVVAAEIKILAMACFDFSSAFIKTYIWRMHPAR